MKKKILIFIVAYNAEKHIEKVLNRIPEQILKKYDHEVLIIDDASKDRTFEVGKGFQKVFKKFNLKVLYNPVNQGYGGNQKLGYQYAIKYKFDIVVLLHGDGQYAPEMIEKMFLPILEGKADIVMGSRFLTPGKALKGNMPLYKYIGNIILSKFQNIILGTTFSEFHSGYRAYSVNSLKLIPFEKNSNDFHFDTQIIIQMLLAKQTFLEIPIPTYYGNEICHVDGIDYALNVVKTTLLSKLHQASIFHQPEYDINNHVHYPAKLDFLSSHTVALSNLPIYSTLLSIGCGDGYLEAKLKEKKCFIAGIDKYKPKLKNTFDVFYSKDLDHLDKLPKIANLEYILLLDIIEHLSNPEQFLTMLNEYSSRYKAKIILTTGNVAFFLIRLQLLFGRFNYGSRGILDFTHKRLFTFKSITRILNDSGFKVTKYQGIPAPFPLALGNNWLSLFLIKINNYLINLNKELFSFQIYIEAVPSTKIDDLLNLTLKTEKHDHKKITK